MIRIENLSVAFDGPEVVKNVSLTIEDGEILGLVGESGSGKSVTALTLMGLAAQNARVTTGKIYYDDTLLLEAGKPRDNGLYREFQGDKMSMVFQEPMTSLNPTKKVGAQVEEMLILHARDMTREKRREKVLEAFRDVGLQDAERVYGSYPHQLSGGMRQRAMIAMAVILRPGLLVADEPTTALDVTVQNQIVGLLREINGKYHNAMLFITHDLNLARRICRRIAVMKDGRLVEQGETEQIFEHPVQDYTRRLIEAVPSRMKKEGKRSSFGSSTPSGAGPDPGAPVPVVQVRDLSVFYRDGDGPFSRKRRSCAVKDVSFDLWPGESLGLVGESGCGKTTLSKAILGIHRDVEGQVLHNTRRPQMIFQDPYSSLNPVKTVGWQLQEPLRARAALDGDTLTKEDMEAAAYDMLHKVGLEDPFFFRRPSQLSGGQRQRVSIAQALITSPGFIVADEPVSALDVTIQAQILELMRKLQQEMNLSYLFISHDIHVIYKMCSRVMVMREGRVIEIGDTEELFEHPKEAYTRQLLCDS